MRIRYERRDPRPEDIRRIDELKSMVDSQEKDIFYLTEQLRESQLLLQQQQQQNPIIQQNSNVTQPNKRNRGKNNKNNSRANNVKQQNLQQPNEESCEQQQQQPIQQNHQQQRQQSPRMRPPPLIKTVIYEEENENELYEEQLREERARQNESIPITIQNLNCTIEFVPESPDYLTKNGDFSEEISEALLVQPHEIINQRVIPSPTPDDFKNQEITVEVISTIEPSNIQIIPIENGLDLELD